MKKISIFATALLLAWGCANDFEENIAPESGAKGVFNVVADADAGSRTAYSEVDGVLTASWKAADEIDIISMVDGGEAPYEKLTYTADAAGTKVAFSPKTDALTLKEGGQNYKFYAYYHYWKHNSGTSDISYEDGVPYLTLHMNGSAGNGGMQGAVDNDGTSRLYRYDVLYATPVEVANPSGNVDLNFQFNHAFAVLEFKLNTTGSENISVKKISVTGDDLIASSVKVNLTNGELTVNNVISPQVSNMNFNKQPVLEANGANSYSCYMTILPGHAGKQLTITITDQNEKTYTFEKTPSKDILAGQRAVLPLDVKAIVEPEPEPTAIGVASTTPELVWSKKLNEIEGVVNHLNVNGLAVSGDYLLLSEKNNSNPVYLNALTGAKEGTMNVSAVTAKSTNYYATNDEGGHIWFSTAINRPTGGGTFYVFEADNVTATPAEMFNEAAAATDRYGWKVSVSGSKASKALVVTPYYAQAAYTTKYVRRYYWDGSTTTRVEQFATTGLTNVDTNDYNWVTEGTADAMNASADKASDLFTISSSKAGSKRYLTWSTMAWVGANNRYQGTKKEEFAVTYASSGYSATYTNSLDYIEFNGATYLAYNTVNSVSNTNTSDDCTYLMDITNGAFTTATPISEQNAHGSVTVNGVANSTKLADVQLHASSDGNYLYAYVMFAGGEVACYRYEAAK